MLIKKRYTYLIKDDDNGLYKIGIAKDPQKRLKELQTGNPFQLRIVETYLSEYSNKVEKSLHRKYSHLKKEGEWFNLSIKDEVLFLTDCKKIEETLMFLEFNNNPFI